MKKAGSALIEYLPYSAVSQSHHRMHGCHSSNCIPVTDSLRDESDLLVRSVYIGKKFCEYAGPMQIVLPEHTRDALFQLFCELRTNTKKDQKWAYQHGRALKPRTFPGWIVSLLASWLWNWTDCDLSSFLRICLNSCLSLIVHSYCYHSAEACGTYRIELDV